MSFTIAVNGAAKTLDVDGEMPLLWALRDTLGLVGTKYGCGISQCGACTVLLDGQPVRACQTPVASVGKAKVTTIEAVASTRYGKRLQDAWIATDVPQCGYCQAGQIMSATALLTANPKPDDAAIDAAMAGNLCRCATYTRIRAAIKLAAAAPVRA